MSEEQEHFKSYVGYVGYVGDDYLTAVARRSVHIKEYALEEMRLRPSLSVLDVGCGPASDTLTFAAQVGETGSVWGVDHDLEMIEKANRRAEQAGVAGYVKHRHADVAALPFDDDTFDAIHCERVFQHLTDAPGALAEMVRVTRPDGYVVVNDTDHTSCCIDTVSVELRDVEWGMRRTRAVSLKNSYSGREVFRLFHDAGLEDIKVKPFAVGFTSLAEARFIGGLEIVEREAVSKGFLSQNDVERWRSALEQEDARGSFFMYIVVTVTSGRKSKGS